MRYSKYNLYFKDQYDNIVIYNTLSNKYFVVENDNVRGTFIPQGFVTSLTEVEEISMCDAIFYEGINSNDMSITIITTKQCNFSCKYCAQSQRMEVMQQETYYAIERYILRNINSFNTLRITLFGGEPTLVVDNYENFLVNVNKLCKFYRKNLNIAIITNGYLLDDDMVSRLYNAHVWQYTITLDGPPKLHDSYRMLKNGSPTFGVIYKNLRRIKERKDLVHIKIVIRINITQNTVEEIEEWKHLYEDLLNDPRFFLELSVVENRGGNGINDLKGQLVQSGDATYATIFNTFSSYKKGLEKLKPNIFVCGYLNSQSLTIDCQGELRACSKLYMNNQIGRLLSNGRIQIDDKYKLFKVKYDNNCRGCTLEPLCQGKRCGFSTVCLKEEIIFIISENLKREGVFVCQMLSPESVTLPLLEKK